ncbi:MAG: SDR family NAD(P)-dependent oxidoreductase [Microthrixaceae bacterium]
MFDLTGRTALVTGGGRGVGAAIAATLAARGAAVAVNDLIAHRAESTAAALRTHGGRAVAVPFDITDGDAVDAGVADAVAALGRPIDILVNNAGPPAGMTTTPFREMTPTEWQPFVDINLYGSLHCIRSVIDPMVAAGHGRILQISSGAARTGIAFGVSLYGASKSGIEGFIRHLSQELAPTGVTANVLALGLLSNAVPEGTPDGAVTALTASIPVGRLGQPDDVAAAALYLVSDEASWMTGQTISLNGGSTTN